MNTFRTLIGIWTLLVPSLVLSAEVSKDKAEELGVTWVVREQTDANKRVAMVVEFTNKHAKQQYTIKFKVSYSGTNSMTRNTKMVSKKDHKVVVNPSSKETVVVEGGPGFGFSSTPTVVELSLSRTNSR
jgi:hypothetical protein